jgi:hypothetical protein
LALLGQMPQDCLIGVETVSCHVGVGEAIKGVAVPSLDSLKPRLLGMVETHQGADAREVKAPRVESGDG